MRLLTIALALTLFACTAEPDDAPVESAPPTVVELPAGDPSEKTTKRCPSGLRIFIDDDVQAYKAFAIHAAAGWWNARFPAYLFNGVVTQPIVGDPPLCTVYVYNDAPPPGFTAHTIQYFKWYGPKYLPVGGKVTLTDGHILRAAHELGHAAGLPDNTEVSGSVMYQWIADWETVNDRYLTDNDFLWVWYWWFTWEP